ncbi:MAG: Glu-tRNA(Gln) amidotransferase subunit GatD [Methermicoccaceae archaeon]
MEVNDRVRAVCSGVVYEGILMPSSNDYVVLKLKNGYNIGIKPDSLELIEPNLQSSAPKPPLARREGLPEVSILSTGGTIASRVDYRTGAVSPKFDAQDIVDAIPEMGELANFRARVVFSILSENMQPSYWTTLARAVCEEVEAGADGVVIAHGTDTMAYTAAALSFMLETPVPVVLVGAQRSADRPSSDNAMNALCATKVAVSDIAEVSVVMHGSTSDDYCLVHRGCKVRKMHTSRRDAFKSINSSPIAQVGYPELSMELLSDYRRRGSSELALHDKLEERCALVKYVPGATPALLDFYVDRGYRGIVLEGTGLGHVGSHWIPSIQQATEKGVIVVSTSQCLFGRVCNRVYDNGRDMLRAGVIEGEDMLPEVALVKLMWLLGNYSPEKARELVKVNLKGELEPETGGEHYF